ncbi:hypothetical protein BH10PLA1_BH10PLA1_16410 [soil metagenome]
MIYGHLGPPKTDAKATLKRRGFDTQPTSFRPRANLVTALLSQEPSFRGTPRNLVIQTAFGARDPSEYLGMTTL